MTPAQFFEKFDLLSELPNAVGKMREFVLWLAVRGKLTKQELSEESGTELVARIWQELARTRNIQKPPVPNVDDRGDLPTLPGEWTWAQFCEIAIIASNLVKPMDYLDSIHLAPDNIEKGNGKLLPCRTVRDDEVKSANHRFFSGQIVYSKIRPNLAKVAVVNFDGLCSADMYPIDSLIDSRYLQIFMLSDVFLSQSVKNDTRVAMPKINQAELNAILVAVPPLAEQKRIVAKVDELMALCDRLEAQQKQREAQQAALVQASLTRFTDAPTPTNLEFLFHKSYAVDPAELRKTILTLAVQGKLVLQDTSDETPSLSFPGLKTLETCESEIPGSWIHVHYRAVTSLVTSGSRGWKEFYSNSGAVFIRTQNINTDRLVLDDVAFVDLPKSTEGMRTQVAQDDILITITGANVTRAARVEGVIAEAYVSQHIALTRPRWANMSKWLHLCFLSDGAARGQLEKLAYGDKPGLNLNNIRDLVMPIPPLAEQKRIVAKVEELMGVVDRLEAQLAASREVGAKLIDAVVAEIAAAA